MIFFMGMKVKIKQVATGTLLVFDSWKFLNKVFMLLAYYILLSCTANLKK